MNDDPPVQNRRGGGAALAGTSERVAHRDSAEDEIGRLEVENDHDSLAIDRKFA